MGISYGTHIDRHRNSVGILVDEELRMQVVEVGLGKKVKAGFYEALDEVVRGMPSLERIVIAGDFNGHIGIVPGGYDDVHGGFGFGYRNEEGAVLLDFVRAFGLLVKDLFMKKSKKRRVKKGRPRIRWDGLIPDSELKIEEKVVVLGVWDCRGDVDAIWDKAASCIMKTTRDVLDISRGQAG
ncbi:uncharacterized protein LOC107857511 [Capsicum annuum]|uniref:uncharacterized protein LOC107857511 n=1 Tax=Capsicum annuum TaxID=4072 RepID=UPI001FB0E417|nr:uncharacterized protein LOC107857511 [Capsicum annuum]